jgi:hypothetical protein
VIVCACCADTYNSAVAGQAAQQVATPAEHVVYDVWLIYVMRSKARCLAATMQTASRSALGNRFITLCPP